ncbi:MAG: transglutaminase family protein [Chloroflexota bacterium]
MTDAEVMPPVPNAPTISGSEMAALAVLDHTGVDWDRVHRTAFLIHQYLRYDYPGPIEDLNHRLMVVPPEHHLDQRRVVHRVEIASAEARVTERLDGFGNLILDLHAAYVDASIDFEAWIVVERSADGPARVEAATLRDERLLQPSSRTRPDGVIAEAGRALLAAGHRGLDLAEAINGWVAAHLRYAHDVTDIHTTAAEALALGRGVCQDYAHIMLALCRFCGLPARYVSGHLLGEGGTHAWVEVIVADDVSGDAVVHAFDPTHDRRAGMSYVTVAVGRDYADVAPTSGTFRASYSGRLSARKRVGLTAIDYQPV